MTINTLRLQSAALALGLTLVGCSNSDDKKPASGDAGSGGSSAGGAGASGTGGSGGDTHHGSGGTAGAPGSGGMGGMGGMMMDGSMMDGSMMDGASGMQAPMMQSVMPMSGGLHVMWMNMTTNCDKIELLRNKNGGAYSVAYTLTGAATSQHDTQATAPGTYCYKARCVKGSQMSPESNEKCGTP